MFDNSGETAIADLAASRDAASPPRQQEQAAPRSHSRLSQALRRLAEASADVSVGSAGLEVPELQAESTAVSSTFATTVTTATAKPAAPATQGSDRRTHPRWGSACEVLACVKSGKPGDDLDWIFHRTNLRGRLTDISMGGLSLRLNQPVPAETILIFRLTNRHFEKSVDAEGTVLRCQPNADGSATLVCRLARKLSFEQVHLLGKQLFDSTIV